ISYSKSDPPSNPATEDICWTIPGRLSLYLVESGRVQWTQTSVFLTTPLGLGRLAVEPVVVKMEQLFEPLSIVMSLIFLLVYMSVFMPKSPLLPCAISISWLRMENSRRNLIP